jgi:hypothetical protein
MYSAPEDIFFSPDMPEAVNGKLRDYTDERVGISNISGPLLLRDRGPYYG